MSGAQELRVIARIETDFPAKFGIPRQAGVVPELEGRILTLLEQCIYGIHGMVVDAYTHQPIEGVTVTVLNHDDEYSIVQSPSFLYRLRY